MDEKGARVHKEYERVAARLEEAVKLKEEFQEKYDAATTELRTAKEDLDVTRANYDTQMSMLTEHTVRLSEDIRKAETTIAKLKSHKVCGRMD